MSLQRRLRQAFSGLTALAVLGLAGCGSIGSGGLVDKSLEAVGLKVPDTSAVQNLPKLPTEYKLPLRIHAAEQLNTDRQGRPLSVVVRIYKLKDSAAFLGAPYDAFKNVESEKAAIGRDQVDVREVVLTPGQLHEVMETLKPDAPYLGVVALFRSPANGRWRFVFDAKAAQQRGITLGVHDCGMSVASGEAIGAPPETLRMAGVRCQ